MSSCKLDCYGSPMKSTADEIFSVAWRKNSCAIDAIFACLQMVYVNLSVHSTEIFDNQFNRLTTIIKNLNNGSIDNHESKLLLEYELDQMIGTSNDSFREYRNHNFTQAIIFSELFAGYINANPIFCTTYNIEYSCEKCKTSSSALFVDLTLYPGVKIAKCKQCDTKTKDISGQSKEIINLPVILIASCNMWVNKSQMHLFVQGAFLLDNYQHFGQEYRLMACVYGDGNHFTCMARKNKDIYYCDGMVKNAQYVRLNDYDRFQMKYDGKTVNQGFYIRIGKTHCDDSCNISCLSMNALDALLADSAVDHNEDLHQSTCNAATKTSK